MLEKLCPSWPTADLAASERFYRRLGFTALVPGPYLILKRDKVEVHFYLDGAYDPKTQAGSAYLRSDDVDALSDEWAQLGLPEEGYPRFVPAEDKSWGMRECALVDNSGHLIRAGIEIPGWSPPDA